MSFPSWVGTRFLSNTEEIAHCKDKPSESMCLALFCFWMMLSIHPSPCQNDVLAGTEELPFPWKGLSTPAFRHSLERNAD